MSTDAQAKAYTEFDYKDAQGIEIAEFIDGLGASGRVPGVSNAEVERS